MAATVEKRIKDLEERMNNAEIRNKRLKAELDTAISGIMKTLSKHQRESYEAFRKELKAKTDEERKKAEDERKRFFKEHQVVLKQLEITRKEVKSLLR